MSENTEKKQGGHTITLPSLLSPRVIGDLLAMTEEEIVAAFVTASETYGVKVTFIRGSWRMLAQRILVATSPKK